MHDLRFTQASDVWSFGILVVEMYSTSLKIVLLPLSRNLILMRVSPSNDVLGEKYGRYNGRYNGRCSGRCLGRCSGHCRRRFCGHSE